APPKKVWKKSENGSASPNISRISSSVIVRKPPPCPPAPKLIFQAPPAPGAAPLGPAPAPACSYIRQLEPSSSYFFLFTESPSTSYASVISLNLLSADLFPGLTSGWYLRASFRYVCLIS